MNTVTREGFNGVNMLCGIAEKQFPCNRTEDTVTLEHVATVLAGVPLQEAAQMQAAFDLGAHTCLHVPGLLMVSEFLAPSGLRWMRM